MQVVGLILRILSRAEVNWEVVLCVVSLTLHLLPEADGLMHRRYQAIIHKLVKGVCHEIFDPYFFQDSNPSVGP